MRPYDTQLASGKRDAKKTKDGGPAFGHGNPEQGGNEGMSLLDFFAAAALIGLLHSQSANKQTVEDAWDCAEAMLATRFSRTQVARIQKEQQE